MHKVIITSAKFTGSLEFEMDFDGVVKIFHNLAQLDSDQLQWLSTKFPITLDRLNKMIVDSPSIKAELIQTDLSFATFWDMWPMKRNKIRAERYWSKLSDADKLLALKNIKPYLRYLERHPHQAMMYPDTYLNPVDRRFENEYK